MSILVVGLSHRTAPMALLERVALSGDGVPAKLAATLCDGDCVAEALVLSTCNRLEVYADVSKFHDGVAEVGSALSAVTGVSLEELSGHLYVHYEAAAVGHLFTVASGLDSMAVGETQMLGQVRAALRVAQEAGTAGPGDRSAGPAGTAGRQARRTPRPGWNRPGLDARGRAGPRRAGSGRPRWSAPGAAGRSALVVGAGAMSAVAAAALQRAGVGRLTVASRTAERAERLAASRQAGWLPMPDAGDGAGRGGRRGQLHAAPGPRGHGRGRRQAARRPRRPRPGLPRPRAAPRRRAGGGRPARRLPGRPGGGRAAALAGHGIGRRGGRGAGDRGRGGRRVPRRAARRGGRAHRGSAARARPRRGRGRAGPAERRGWTGSADGRARAELEQTVHRVVEKLLHTPTVRVKELAGEPGGVAYADALRELFGLDLDRVAAVTDAWQANPGRCRVTVTAIPDRGGPAGPAAAGHPAQPAGHRAVAVRSPSGCARWSMASSWSRSPPRRHQLGAAGRAGRDRRHRRVRHRAARGTAGRARSTWPSTR